MFSAPSSTLQMLFPHRWDFIFSPHVPPEAPAQWFTESRYPLTDRSIEAGEKLYGVRFGSETEYFMLDIDKGSMYHPKRDPFAIRKIIHAFDYLGLTDCIPITSSYSNGVHIYFPLNCKVLTWQLAAVVQHVLSSKGFCIQPSLLEVFPNVREWSDEEHTLLSMYNAHRLPMQAGSYLLSPSWELQVGDFSDFARRWFFCTQRNELSHRVFERLLREISDKEQARRLSRPAGKFLQDLQTDIAPGWTGRGQTNFLLGRIALRSYVFGHVLEGCRPLSGERLVAAIVNIAQKLPGYETFCRHQHEIRERAEEWARCVENCKRYFHYGRKQLSQKPPEPEPESKPTVNQQRMADARERLDLAIAVMLHNDCLPNGITERFEVLTTRFRFSGETLYKHRDLWHPGPEADPCGKPPAPPELSEAPLPGACSEGAPPQKTARNLLTSTGRNPSPLLDWSAFSALLEYQNGCNALTVEDLKAIAPLNPVDNSLDSGGGG